MTTRLRSFRRSALFACALLLVIVATPCVLSWRQPPHPPIRFIAACATASLDEVTARLKAGEDVNQVDSRGFTPLMIAANAERADIVRLLLERGANPNATMKAGASTLYYAAGNANPACAEWLIRFGANVPQAEDALMAAVLNDRAPIIRLLVWHGANINAYDKADGRTALMWAAQWTSSDTVALLIQHGAKVNTRNNDGSTALMFAARVGSDNAQVLLHAGAEVNARNRQHETVLSICSPFDTGTRRLLKVAGAKE